MKDVLICVTGHANTEDRKSTVIKLLKSLKSKNLNVCYLTHCSDYLDEIVKYADYLYFDNNNLLIHTGDYVNNSDLFDQDSIYYGCNEFNFSDSFGKILINQIPPHCPAVLILQKNAVHISFVNSFKWTIMVDYDVKEPTNGFLNYFQDKIEFLEKNDKKCLMYTIPNRFYDFACIMIFQSEKLFQNELLMKYDWYTSPRNWIKHFKLGLSEFITQIIFKNVFKNDLVKVSLIEDCKKYWNTDNHNEITIYTYTGYKQFANIAKIFPYKKKEGGYLLIIYLQNNTHNLFQLNNFVVENVSKNTVLYERNKFDLQPSCWFFDSLNSNLFDFNDTLRLKYDTNYDNESKTITEIYDLNTIDKIHDYIMHMEFKS